MDHDDVARPDGHAPRAAKTPAAYKPFPDPLPPVVLSGSVNLLAGAPGAGKSKLLVMLVERLRAREAFFGLNPAPCPFQGWIAVDRSWERSTKKWFEVAGVIPPKVYSLADDPGFKKHRLRNRKDRLGMFLEMLGAVSPRGDGKFPAGSLVYCDPISLFLGGNLADYDTCAVACMELRELCLEGQFTLVGTVHTPKQPFDKKARYLRIQDRLYGSAALLGFSDTVLSLATPEEMGIQYTTFHWAPHHAPAQAFALSTTADGLFLPMHEMTGEAPAKEDWIYVALSGAKDKTLSTGEIVDAGARQGLARATVMRQLDTLITEGRIERVGRGKYRLIDRVEH